MQKSGPPISINKGFQDPGIDICIENPAQIDVMLYLDFGSGFKRFVIVFRGLYFDKHLKFMRLNEKFVPFTKMDLSYLLKVSHRLYSFPITCISVHVLLVNGFQSDSKCI